MIRSGIRLNISPGFKLYIYIFKEKLHAFFLSNKNNVLILSQIRNSVPVGKHFVDGKKNPILQDCFYSAVLGIVSI